MLKPPPAANQDTEMTYAKSPATSQPGEKRKRDEDDEGGDSDDSDVAMEEDSDDD